VDNEPLNESNTSVSYITTWFATTYANSTYTFVSHQSVTSDYYFSLVINITCSGCAFSGEYVGSYPPSTPTQVSGNGSKSYYVGSFDSPIGLTWNISKDSSGGTLEVKVGDQIGQTYYDKVTSAPLGTLSGGWSLAVLYGSMSSTTPSTSTVSNPLNPLLPFLLLTIGVVATIALLLAVRRASKKERDPKGRSQEERSANKWKILVGLRILAGLSR
jgi:hypothetical protein